MNKQQKKQQYFGNRVKDCFLEIVCVIFKLLLRVRKTLDQRENEK